MNARVDVYPPVAAKQRVDDTGAGRIRSAAECAYYRPRDLCRWPRRRSAGRCTGVALKYRMAIMRSRKGTINRHARVSCPLRSCCDADSWRSQKVRFYTLMSSDATEWRSSIRSDAVRRARRDGNYSVPATPVGCMDHDCRLSEVLGKRRNVEDGERAKEEGEVACCSDPSRCVKYYALQDCRGCRSKGGLDAEDSKGPMARAGWGFNSGEGSFSIQCPANTVLS